MLARGQPAGICRAWAEVWTIFWSRVSYEEDYVSTVDTVFLQQFRSLLIRTHLMNRETEKGDIVALSAINRIDCLNLFLGGDLFKYHFRYLLCIAVLDM